MPAHNLRGRWWAKRLWWSFFARLRNQHNWLYGDRVTNVRNFQLVCLGQRILRKACTNGRLLRRRSHVRWKRRSSGPNSDRCT
jgi:hypothetical protein